MKLTLGTVQFGMDYGIQGAQKPTKETVFTILEYAIKNGIDTLDTASGYGDAESLIGEYLDYSNNRVDIISKLSGNIFDNITSSDYINIALNSLENSLKKLKIAKLKGLLFHNPAYLYDKNAVNSLLELKRLGLIDLIGVSVYEPKDAEYALKIGMNMVQIPSNIFDRRFDSFLDKAKNFHVKVFSRSVYLQGLLLMEVEEVFKKLPSAVKYVETFDKLCTRYKFTRREVALSYMKKKYGVHSIVFGVDNLRQLKENIDAYYQEVPIDIVDEIALNFENISEDIVSPLKWRIK